ncbi:MAG TPA: ATP-dependent metallopeptidase FtsH/Yme1/Tma family protein, partial [Nitrolancea sp.]|nr:ATP-dependent metallopeptidase FtsH/Yme1/Tma family protein [Nitrolancea sp.]
MVIGGIAFYYVYVLFWPTQTAKLDISYSGLVQQVQAGNVKEVTIEGQAVTGSFTQEMQLINNQLLPASQTPPVADTGSKATKGT